MIRVLKSILVWMIWIYWLMPWMITRFNTQEWAAASLLSPLHYINTLCSLLEEEEQESLLRAIVKWTHGTTRATKTVLDHSLRETCRSSFLWDHQIWPLLQQQKKCLLQDDDDFFVPLQIPPPSCQHRFTVTQRVLSTASILIVGLCGRPPLVRDNVR